MTKGLKIFFILIAVLIIFFGMATFASIAKFDVANPFAVFKGLYQIIFTDTKYVEIQAYPRVILAKPEVSLEIYMKNKGFTENEDEQLGALRVFEYAESKEYVVQSVNKYFAKWCWNE